MARFAGNCPVGTLKFEYSGVIKAVQIVPVFGGVARFTPGRLPVVSGHFHAFRELRVVGIPVTGGAGAILVVIAHRLRFVRDRVALGACHCQMRSGQREAALVVSGNGKSGKPERFHRVTTLAIVVEGRARELALVDVFMAAAATGTDAIQGIPPLWRVAFVTGQ